MFARSSTNRHLLLQRLALLAMLFKLVFPLGYMPGNLLAGEWLVLCPQGLPAGLLAADTHHHHGADADADDSSTDRSSSDQQRLCPLGSGFAMAGMANHGPSCCSHDIALQPINFLLLAHANSTGNYKARAPPV